jgi:hypothetical protein
MYADEASIGGEYDPDMTRLKQTPRSSRTNSAETGLSAAQKKSPLSERASNYFLGGE